MTKYVFCARKQNCCAGHAFLPQILGENPPHVDTHLASIIRASQWADTLPGENQERHDVQTNADGYGFVGGSNRHFRVVGYVRCLIVTRLLRPEPIGPKLFILGEPVLKTASFACFALFIYMYIYIYIYLFILVWKA